MLGFCCSFQTENTYEKCFFFTYLSRTESSNRNPDKLSQKPEIRAAQKCQPILNHSHVSSLPQIQFHVQPICPAAETLILCHYPPLDNSGNGALSRIKWMGGVRERERGVLPAEIYSGMSPRNTGLPLLIHRRSAQRPLSMPQVQLYKQYLGTLFSSKYR